MPNRRQVVESVLNDGPQARLELLDRGLVDMFMAQTHTLSARSFVAKAVFGLGPLIVNQITNDEGGIVTASEIDALADIIKERWALLHEQSGKDKRPDYVPAELPKDPPDYTIARDMYTFFQASAVAVGLFAGEIRLDGEDEPRQRLSFNALRYYCAAATDFVAAGKEKIKSVVGPDGNYMTRHEVMDESKLIGWINNKCAGKEKIVGEAELKKRLWRVAYDSLGKHAQAAIDKKDAMVDIVKAAAKTIEMGKLSDASKADAIVQRIAEVASNVGVQAADMLPVEQQDALRCGTLLTTPPADFVKTIEPSDLYDDILDILDKLADLVKAASILEPKPDDIWVKSVQDKLHIVAQTVGLVVTSGSSKKTTEPPEPTNGQGEEEEQAEAKAVLQPAD